MLPLRRRTPHTSRVKKLRISTSSGVGFHLHFLVTLIRPTPCILFDVALAQALIISETRAVTSSLCLYFKDQLRLPYTLLPGSQKLGQGANGWSLSFGSPLPITAFWSLPTFLVGQPTSLPPHLICIYPSTMATERHDTPRYCSTYSCPFHHPKCPPLHFPQFASLIPNHLSSWWSTVMLRIECVPPQKCGSPNSQDLWMWTFLEIGFFCRCWSQN